MENKTIVIVVIIVATVLALPILAKLKGNSGSQTATQAGSQAPAAGTSSGPIGSPDEMTGNIVIRGQQCQLSALAAAAYNGDKAKIQQWIDKGLSLSAPAKWIPPADSGNDNNVSVLYFALNGVYENHVNMDFARWVAENGAKTDYAIFWETICPTLSARKDIVDLIVRQMPDVNSVSFPGSLPVSPIFMTFNSSGRNALEALLARGANVNCRHPIKGWTPLTAVKNSNMEPQKKEAIIQLLLQYGATE